MVDAVIDEALSAEEAGLELRDLVGVVDVDGDNRDVPVMTDTVEVLLEVVVAVDVEFIVPDRISDREILYVADDDEDT